MQCAGGGRVGGTGGGRLGPTAGLSPSPLPPHPPCLPPPQANSGHPGLPMGCAPMTYVLYRDFLKADPKAPKWDDRDRFVLSAGHGSMLQYSMLHLMGYNLKASGRGGGAGGGGGGEAVGGRLQPAGPPQPCRQLLPGLLPDAAAPATPPPTPTHYLCNRLTT